MKAIEESFGLTCPFCGVSEDSIFLDLNDMREVQCGSCEKTYSVWKARDAARANADGWDAVCRWLDLLPIQPGRSEP